MVKDGHEDGRQKWACRHRVHAQYVRFYAKHGERERARQRAIYEQNPLPKLMRQQAKYHQKRLAELQQAVTEGGRDG